MTKVHGLISMSEKATSRRDRNTEIQRIAEDYTSKVNALIEDNREDLLEGMGSQYLLDLQGVTARAAEAATPSAA
ncbi:MAG TPA: hypothetical protein VFN61_06855 [Acidimicrobiales bacterium]|nr:hypothetical protein [Acidimicrobiales bacterium]